MFAGVELVNVRVKNIESVGIPKCAHEFTLTFNYRFPVKAVRQPRGGVGIEVPAYCVGTVLFEGVKRVDGVAL